jgi:hypothetical protein
VEIVEQKVLLKGQAFTKSEIEEISSFFDLASDGVTYTMKTGNIKQGNTLIPIAAAIRNSPAMQKAMQAMLFASPDETVIIASLDLRPALELYRK